MKHTHDARTGASRLTKRSDVTYLAYIDDGQVAQLKHDLLAQGFRMREDVPHAFYGASKNGVSVTAFRNGKLLIQGKGAHDFILFYLEPILLKKVSLGYEELIDPSIAEARIGVDESGKGDYFGPLIIAAVYVDKTVARSLLDLGVADSKQLGAKRIKEMAEVLKRQTVHSVVAIGPEKYNGLYEKISNLNRLLAWGHARALENVLIKKAACKKAILDKFADKSVLNLALMKRAKKIDISFRERAESDVAVAAASVIARHEFVSRLEKLGEEFKMEFPKGAGAAVEEAAKKFVAVHGIEGLAHVAKLHFKISKKVILES
ncbi:MAG: ribonuclease HIII [Candidatus Aureabacteria bacterium]|nr:ribonuclease HIII [Candidatus Auribacterota bacterium]